MIIRDKTSIGRAEVMMDMLIEAATELSRIINCYKLDELKKQRRELDQSDMSDLGSGLR